MKKKLTILFAFAIAGFSQSATAQQDSVAGAQIEFENQVHNFGELTQHDPAVCEFVFTNTGDQTLIISTCKSSCGCVVATCPREPIPPGESSIVKVKYDSKRLGPINKSVIVTSNAKNKPTLVLRIKGNISTDSSKVAPTQGGNN
jgi:hypothetical protein